MKLSNFSKVMIHTLLILLVGITFLVFCHMLHLERILIPFFNALIPLIIGLSLSVLVDPWITYFEKTGVSRKICCFVVYFLLMLMMAMIVKLLYPEILHQYDDFMHALPQYQQAFEQFMNQDNMVLLRSLPIDDQIHQVIESSIRSLSSFLSSFFDGLGTLLIGFSGALYFSLEKYHMIRIIKERFKKKNSTKILNYGRELSWITRCFMKAILLDTLFFFMASYIGLSWIDLGNELTLAIFLALTNLIPYIGPYIGGIPVILIGLMQSEKMFLWTCLLVVGIQYVESTFIQPLLMYRHIHIHPLWTIFGISFFGAIFGFLGMVLSPLFLAYIAWLWSFFKKEIL